MLLAAPAAPKLSDGQLSELLSISADVDSVELKLTIPESAELDVAAALGIDPLDAQIRQVYFFDTPALSLDGQGVALSARRVGGRAGDSVVKLRPVQRTGVPAPLRTQEGLSVEVDALPGQLVCSATLKRRVRNADIRAVVTGRAPLIRLFSNHQLALLSEHQPARIHLDDLVVLGPVLVLRRRLELETLERPEVGARDARASHDG
jgi:hypothetical protein